MSEPPPAPAEDRPTAYGGQAVLEGVMMRGGRRWAVAVRRPDRGIWLEAHPVEDPTARRLGRVPLIRGCYALGDSLRTGLRALQISADQALAAESPERQDGIKMGRSLLVAALLAGGLFIVLPTSATKGLDALVGGALGDGVPFHLVESFLRIAVFLGYLLAVSRLPDIRRTFQYHGAEHQTIAAWEQGAPLHPDAVGRFSTLHVRCGTNFLILVMLLAIVVTSVGGLLVPPPAEVGWVGSLTYHVLLRVVLLPLIAGLAYEGLKLGAAFGDRAVVAAMMAPGLWLQRITTRPPTRDQVEVAIRAFEAVVPAEDLAQRGPSGLDSPLVLADAGLLIAPSSPAGMRDVHEPTATEEADDPATDDGA